MRLVKSLGEVTFGKTHDGLESIDLVEMKPLQ